MAQIENENYNMLKKVATCEWVCPKTKASLWWVTDFVAEKTGLSFLLAAEEDFVGSSNSQSSYSQIDFEDEIILKYSEKDTKTTVKTLDSKYNELLIPNYWGDVAEKLLDLYGVEIDNGLISCLYHNHLFVLKEDSVLQIPKNDLYRCTAILIGLEIDSFSFPPDTVFAMISDKYHLPENPAWFTFHCQNTKELIDKLKNFKIIAKAKTDWFSGNEFMELIDVDKFNALIAKSHANV